MNFEEWYKETYDPNFGQLHKEWEEKAWNAAIAEAVKILTTHDSIIDTFGEEIFPEVTVAVRKLGE